MEAYTKGLGDGKGGCHEGPYHKKQRAELSPAEGLKGREVSGCWGASKTMKTNWDDGGNSQF